MPEPLSIKGRLEAEAAHSYVRLRDGKHYRMQTGKDNLALSQAIRASDMGQRLRVLLVDNGNAQPDDSLLQGILIELLGLAFEAVPVEVLLRHTSDELLALAEQYFASTRAATPDTAQSEPQHDSDVAFSVMKAAATVGADPWRMWNDWPTWFLKAALEAVPRLEARESQREATAIAVGSGSLKKDAGQRIMREWSRQARGQVNTPKTKRSFEVMMMNLGMPRGTDR